MTRLPAPTAQAVLLEAAPRCLLGESPRWHQGRWWWIDASGGVVFRGEPDDGVVLGNVRAWLAGGARVPVVHPCRSPP